ncbi:MAG TPA: SpoIIE family protein phosphatase [Lacipirellulaceae bacterium]
MTLRRQMMVLIAGPTLLIYILILGLAAVIQYRQSKLEVERAMTRLASSYAARLDGYLREASRIAITSARFMESGATVSDDTVYTMLEDNVRQSPFVYGSCLAFEPGTRRPGEELFAPYVCRDGDGVRRMNIDRAVYDWYRDPQYTWYSEPKRLNHDVWSDPYFDKGAGNILMSTYSANFKSGDSFGGVCTVDIDLPRLRETVGRDIDEQLDFVILSKDGRYVFHPDASRIMARTVFDYLGDAGRGRLSPIFKGLLSGGTGAAWLDGWESDHAVGVFFAPVSSTDWMFVARVPADVVLRDVRRRTLANTAALTGTLLLVCGCIYLVARRIAAPITSLEQGVTKISGGDLETRIDESAPTIEIRHLAESFNRMTADLRTHVDRLAVEKTERQKIEHDLDIARQIQRGLLPTTKPDLPGYDISGWSRAANKTGGDYYDWQTLPNGQLLVSVADVSGHGIGPALVAAVCRAYTRASVPSAEHQLDQIVDRLNELLVADMPEGRFVTFVGVLLDPTRNRAQMVSAGHGPLFRCITSSGELIETGADGLPLGLMSDHQYGPANEFGLEPGDSVLLVTDGLFEWTNAAGDAYGLERLRASILSLAASSADAMIQGLYQQAEQFVGGVPQADDVTIVVVRRV